MNKQSVAKTNPSRNRVMPQIHDNLLNYYLRKISNLPVLSLEEERELVQKAQAGDDEAKRKLVKCNLRLVVNIARRTIHKSNVPMIDLIQEGNVGLISAIEKFNWRYGYKFSTYAAWWVRQAMFKAISEQSFCVKIPVYIQETLSKYSKIKQELEQKHDCVKTADVAKIMNIAPEKIENYLNAYTQTLSIDAKHELDNGSEVQLSDTLVDEKQQNIYSCLEDESLKADIELIISKLKEREQKIIRWRYGMNDPQKRTLEEIGKLYGVTKECIRQTELRAIKKMRMIVEADCLLGGYCCN